MRWDGFAIFKSNTVTHDQYSGKTKDSTQDSKSLPQSISKLHGKLSSIAPNLSGNSMNNLTLNTN
jgi:hypothetical protein